MISKISKLKEMRMKKGLLQWVMAKNLKIHESLLSNIEVGRRDCPEQLKPRIAKILGTSVEELFGRREGTVMKLKSGKKKFISALKIQRVKSGIKQGRLASILGIAQTELSHYESGRRSCPAEIQRKLADILSVDDVDKLFPEHEESLA